MRDISNKPTTLRTAKAQAVVFCSRATIELIREKKIPKGDVFEFARAAGYLGAKNTPHLIPHCHPITIDSLKFDFNILTNDNFTRYTSLQEFRPGIAIVGEAKCIGRTGIEIEAITGVSIAALTIYDILKPFDGTLEISHTKVTEKTGGKSSTLAISGKPICAILVCSDTSHSGKREDTSGKLIKKILEGNNADVVDIAVVADEKNEIQNKIRSWVTKDIHYIFTTGGTGLSLRDITTEAVEELLEKNMIGIAEAMRSHGQARAQRAMFSRSVVGSVNKTIIISLPGSVNGVQESLDAILPELFHARTILLGGSH